MYASFIVHFHTGRMDNLLQTLRFLEKNHSVIAKKSQLITICQDYCDPLPNNFAKYDHFNMEVECMQLPKLTNFGVDQAISKKLVILESDRILPSGYFEAILEELTEGISITTKHMNKLLSPATDDDIIAGIYATTCDDREPRTIGIKNIWSGNTAVMKSDFYSVGKMDESYEGYGWADYDMTFTMENAGIQSIYKENWTELHLWHEGQTYGDGDQKKMYIDNCLKFCKKWKQPVPDYMQKEILEHRKIFI